VSQDLNQNTRHGREYQGQNREYQGQKNHSLNTYLLLTALYVQWAVHMYQRSDKEFPLDGVTHL